jgi:hypothetical protein
MHHPLSSSFFVVIFVIVVGLVIIVIGRDHAYHVYIVLVCFSRRLKFCSSLMISDHHHKMILTFNQLSIYFVVTSLLLLPFLLQFPSQGFLISYISLQFPHCLCICFEPFSPQLTVHADILELHMVEFLQKSLVFGPGEIGILDSGGEHGICFGTPAYSRISGIRSVVEIRSILLISVHPDGHLSLLETQC